jgi:hypothetical protein
VYSSATLISVQITLYMIYFFDEGTEGEEEMGDDEAVDGDEMLKEDGEDTE